MIKRNELWYIYAAAIKAKGNRGLDFPAWEAFIKDLDNIANGVDSKGQPLYVDDNGISWGGIAIFCEGDMELMCVTYGLATYTSAEEMCGWCEATASDEHPYTDLTEHATWRPTENMSNDAPDVSNVSGLSLAASFSC